MPKPSAILALPVLLVAACAGAPAQQAAAPATTCFSSDDAALPAGVSSSVLRIVVQSRDQGRTTRGTGFVVANSAPQDGDANRIVTAAHVVARALEMPETTVIRIARPDGTPVGTARIAATAMPWNPLEALDPGWSDQAVLHLVRFDSAAAEDAYRAAPGLTPDRRQPAGTILDIRASGARGIERGASGAPILADEGRVRGILVQRRVEDWTAGAAAEDPGRSFRASARQREERQVRDGWAQPLSAPAILAALGPAGRGVETSVTAAGPDRLRVLAPAYPSGRCALYSATASLRLAPLATPGSFAGLH